MSTSLDIAAARRRRNTSPLGCTCSPQRGSYRSVIEVTSEMSLLHEAGEALYGPRWQSDLARDLGCNLRTVQRWAADPERVPPGVYTELRELCAARGQHLSGLAERLREREADDASP